MTTATLRAAFLGLLLSPTLALAADHLVGTVDGLRDAVAIAQPGDQILLSAGQYDLYSAVMVTRSGTATAPIVVRAVDPAATQFDVRTQVAFEVRAPHWHFEGLRIRGVCAEDSLCEHAFHVVGPADGTVIRDGVYSNWNAQIKGNGMDSGQGMIFPNDVLIEGNELFSEAARNTGNPVTPIDVVGGRRWVVRHNYIHDFEKKGSDHVSYAAFFKGNSRDGIFERNLVVCEWLHSGGLRLGLSLGGGGTYPDSVCEGGVCGVEHTGGILRNNIIAHCPRDVGIYLNEAANTRVYNNLLFDTVGLDVRFSPSTADIRNNLLSGEIRTRDGGSYTGGSNLSFISDAQWAAWYVDAEAVDFTLLDGAALVGLAQPVDAVIDDFCDRLRDDGLPDLGPVEYDGDIVCDTRPQAFGGDGPGDPSCSIQGAGEPGGMWALLALAIVGRRRRGGQPGAS